MTPSTPGAGTSACWNCGQAIPAGSARCLYCGVPQEAASAALVVAPHGVLGAARPAAAVAVAPAAPASASVLGELFAGAPAGVGARLAAFTIDVVVVAAIGTGVAFWLHSPLLTGLAVAEAVAVLVVLQARTGLGVGNALLRLRVARTDRPFSPGLGRAVLRALVTGVGLLVAGLGGWFVELTAAFDERRRSWGDLASRTVVVAVPSKAERSGPAPASVLPPRSLPRAEEPAPAPAPVAVPTPVVAEAVAPPVDEPVVPVPAPVATPITLPDALVAPPADIPTYDPLAGLERTEVAGTGLDEATELGVVLSFDTGQREQLVLPVVAVLGRAPEPTEPTDALVTVRDPESTVSKNHVRLELSRAGTWVTDAGSTNGTDLLDESGIATRLTPGVRTAVEDGARIRVGNRVFTLSTLVEDVR
jgi:hypothetical protein